jgi:hypothetical protein
MPFEVMVLISNPDSFPDWAATEKRDRYERVVAWHEYAQTLNGEGKVPYAWGSHQLLSRAKLTPSLGLLVAVYRVESWQEFDELLLDDPLRDVSQYATTPLTPLFQDRSSDLRRFERNRDMLRPDASDLDRVVHAVTRALYNKAPDFVGRYEQVEPTNPPTDFSTVESPEGQLEILLIGTNPDEYITLWDDVRKLVHVEKVNWWHDYMAMLIHDQKVSHAWGTNDFCFIGGLSATYAGAAAVFRVKDYEEFDELYRLDPIRETTLFWSVLLQPIGRQRRMDSERLKRAKQPARKR